MLGIDSWIVRSCFPPHPTATQLGYISRRGIAARDFSSTRRSRLAWSRAHDWKSCKRHKRFEGSNPSSSATAKRTGFARPFCCGGGGYRGANRAAERQRKRNDRTRLFYRSSKNYRRRRFGGARTHPRKKRCPIRATLSPALHLKRNASFYFISHFPFSQSLPYGEYPATFNLLKAARDSVFENVRDGLEVPQTNGVSGGRVRLGLDFGARGRYHKLYGGCRAKGDVCSEAKWRRINCSRPC